MSLNWDIKECNFSEEFQKDNWGVIEETIWSTMLVDMGKITKENFDKYEFRLRCYGRAGVIDTTRIINFLPNMIGLITNVYTITDKQFEKKLIGIITHDCAYEQRVAKKLRSKDAERVNQETS